MINRLRQYLTPIIITIGVAVFGATAFAVVPDLVSNLQKDGPAASASDTAKSAVEDAAGTDDQDQAEPSESPDPSESPEGAESDADKAEAAPTPGVNHGNCVSYAARTASADPALKGRMKGQVISSVAHSGAVSGPTTGGAAPSDACKAAYDQAKAAAIAGTARPAHAKAEEANESDNGAANENENEANDAPKGPGGAAPGSESSSEAETRGSNSGRGGGGGDRSGK